MNLKHDLSSFMWKIDFWKNALKIVKGICKLSTKSVNSILMVNFLKVRICGYALPVSIAGENT